MASDLEFRISAELGELKKAVQEAQGVLKNFGTKAAADLDKATKPRSAKGNFLPAGANEEIRNVGNSVKELNGQVGGVISAAKGLVAAFVAFKGLDLFRSFVSEGVQFNSQIEQARLGIASIIAAQSNLVDAQGKSVQGADALAVAIGLSAQQMQFLRQAALETSATTSQLVEAFQSAIGAGISAGLSLDQIRTITVQLVQAAGALGVPMNQLNQEVRSILDGTIDINSRVATTLGITNQQVARWKQSGTLVEELNKRLGSFADAGKLAADNFEVIKSNGIEAIQALSGEITSGLFGELKSAFKDATSGIFDTKTLGITEAFRDLVDLAKELTTDIGEGIGGAIRGAVALAQEFSQWIGENRAQVSELVGSFGLVLNAIGNIVAAVLRIGVGITEVGVKTNALAKVFQVISVQIAGLQDGFRVVAAAVVGLGAAIITAIIAPFDTFLDTVGRAVALINEEAGKTLRGAATTLREIGQRGFEAAGDILKPIADGEGAVANAIKSADKLVASLKKADEERKKATSTPATPPAEVGKITGLKNPVKLPGPDQSQLLKADLERQQKVLEQQYQDNLISLADYFAKRAQLQKAAIDAEIASERAKQARIPKTDENGQREAATRLGLLAQKRKAIDEDADRDALLAKKELYKQIDEAQAQSLENQGRLVEAASIRTQLQYRDLQAKLRENGKTEAAGVIDGLIDTEKAKAKFEEIKTQADRVFAQLASKTAQIADDRDTGKIGINAADEQTKVARQNAIEQLDVLNEKMATLAATTTDPAIKQGAEELAGSYRKLATDSVEGVEGAIIGLRRSLAEMKETLASTVTGNAVDGLSDMFASIATGSKGAGEALRDFVHGFAESMIQLAAKALATFLILETLDAIYPGLGQLAVAGGNVAAKAHHTGGMVGSGGSPRSVNPLLFFGAPRYHDGGLVGLKPDERPAILQTGEEVLTRNDPRNAKNGGASGGQGGGNGTRVVNVLDPSLVAGFLESAQGEEVVLNIIGRNPSKVNQQLRR